MLVSKLIHAGKKDPMHFKDIACSKFDLENLRPWSCLRSKFKVNQPTHPWETAISTLKIKFKVTKWAQHPIDHIPFVSRQSAHPFLRNSYFKIWPWKSQVQGHTVGAISYWLTSLLFHVNQPTHPWETAISKFDLENQVHGHIVGALSYWLTSLLFHVNWPVPASWERAILRHHYFQIWPWKSKSKIKVMAEVLGLTSFELTSFSLHFNWSSIPEIQPFKKNSRLRSLVMSSSRSHSFISIGPPIPEKQIFQNLTLKIQVKVT